MHVSRHTLQMIAQNVGAFVIVLLVSALPACSRSTPAPLPTLAAQAAETPGVATETPLPHWMLTPSQQPATYEPLATVTATPPPPTAAPTEAVAAPKPEADQASAVVGALNRDGPWLVFAASDGLWALDADGSKLTPLDRRPVVSPHDLRTGVSPRGGLLAYVTATDPSQYEGLALNLLSLPGGEIRTLTPLTSTMVEGRTSDLDFQAARAIVEQSSLAWSPNGQQLAFMSAHEGISSDLYVYSLQDDHITRLTDGPSQGFRPTWSPDGKYIVHAGAESFGTGAGYTMAGMWAARADGSELKSLYTPNSGNEVVIGWSAPDTFVVHSWGVDCGERTLRTFNVETGEVVVLWEDFFTHVAMDPTGGSVLLIVDQAVASCNPDGQGGVFLVSPGESAQRVMEGGEAFKPSWSAEVGAFLVPARGGIWRITPAGEVIEPSRSLAAIPEVAPAGQSWAWSVREFQGQPGLWVAQGDQEPVQLSSLPADKVVWDVGGQSLFFWTDGSLYRASGPDFSSQLVIEDVHIGYCGAVWVWP